jgi:hypothetical protein
MRFIKLEDQNQKSVDELYKKAIEIGELPPIFKILGVDAPQTDRLPTKDDTCDSLKKLVLSVLKHKDWIINDIEFSNDDVHSVNIKFKSAFTLGNSPWDPR